MFYSITNDFTSSFMVRIQSIWGVTGNVELLVEVECHPGRLLAIAQGGVVDDRVVADVGYFAGFHDGFLR